METKSGTARHRLVLATLVFLAAASLAACIAAPERPPAVAGAPASAPANVAMVGSPAAAVTPAAAERVTMSTPWPGEALEPLAHPPAGQYLFVEWYHADEGIGDLPFQPDPPAGNPADDGSGRYDFEPESGNLEYDTADPLVAGEWGFWGHAYHITGTLSHEVHHSLTRILALPFDWEIRILGGIDAGGAYQWRNAGVILRAVTADGTVRIEIDGQLVQLAPGSSWERSDQVEVRTAQSAGIYRSRYRITNHGWLDRAQAAAGRMRRGGWTLMNADEH